MTAASTTIDGLELDVAVIGAGFAGLYAMKKLRDDLGLTVHGFDDATDVGGTWYWNRYPGVRVDTEAHVYQYSFDTELMTTWDWSERYPRGPEVLRYMNAVADKHDLRRSYSFGTRIVSATWDDSLACWTLTTDKGARVSARFVVEAVGLLSSTKYPRFDGEETFKGRVLHAARWPHEGIELSGKRVAIVGTGSTGTQMAVDLAPQVGHLHILQRTPQYVVPLGCGPFVESERDRIKADPAAFRDWQLNTNAVFGFQESTLPTMSVSAEERQARFEKAWADGNGFAFMLKTFGDTIVDREANKAATDFILSKMRSIVKDPATADKLTPTDLFAKRPLACDGYYEMYNRDNVTLHDVKSDPIVRVVPEGVQLQSGKVIEIDILIYATGFDAVTGNYLKIDTTGRGGLRLADKWKDGPSANLGLTIAGFPNLFMVFGPFTPFTSQPLVHEWQVDWIAGAIKATIDRGARTFESTAEAEAAWVKGCNDVAALTLFAVTNSWINGSNIAGKPTTNYFYMSGMASYMGEVNDLTAAGYRGFEIA